MTTPHLRRDPDPSQASGRRVLVGVLIFFLLLVVFVVVLYVAIGRHTDGPEAPPGPSPHATLPS